MNRTALITGATGAIGYAIAEQLADEKNIEVVLAARNESKARDAVTRIIERTENPNVRHVLVNVSDKASIAALAESWQGPLHILINNAAESPRQRQETAAGIERQFATNVLGYFWMTQYFTPILAQSAPSRIINVASYWAGDLDLDDLEFKRRAYRNGTAYRQSKQANRMLTVAFAERLAAQNITVNVCHPGEVSSRLSHSLGFGGHESPDEGARTAVWLATHPIGGEKTGKYFEHRREVHCHFSDDREAIDRLYEICAGYCSDNLP